jgi:uncharacterized protein YdhG (YjbR/CyaY superfamily)
MNEHGLSEGLRSMKGGSMKESKQDAKKRPATKDMDEFLAMVPVEARSALEKLRKTIRTAAPDATETIGYGVPMFKHQGRPLVSFGAGKDHCSFYVMSPAVMGAHARELKGYDTSAGTIRFQAAKPLPAALVKKLVKARISEIETGRSDYRAKSSRRK